MTKSSIVVQVCHHHPLYYLELPNCPTWDIRNTLGSPSISQRLTILHGTIGLSMGLPCVHTPQSLVLYCTTWGSRTVHGITMCPLHTPLSIALHGTIGLSFGIPCVHSTHPQSHVSTPHTLNPMCPSCPIVSGEDYEREICI